MRTIDLQTYLDAMKETGARLMSRITPSRDALRAYIFRTYRKSALGPIQSDEAFFLRGVVKILQPKLIVEFGFYNGDSARNFCRAAPRGCTVISYDITESARQPALRLMKQYPQFRYLHKPQQEFERSDIGGKRIDVVFFDASHEPSINKATFHLVEDSLNENAVLLVHDTGLWDRSAFSKEHEQYALQHPEGWLDRTRFQHQRGEREFVEYIRTHRPEYQLIHFHTMNTLRHGLTVMQRNTPLELSGPLPGEGAADAV